MSSSEIYFVLMSYCASFSLGLHRCKKGVDCHPHFHFPLHLNKCFGTAATAAVLVETGECDVKAGCARVVFFHFSGGTAHRSARASTPRGSFSL